MLPVLLYPKALNLLKGILPGEETQVQISYNSSNAFFSFNNINLICRLIDAQLHPDYNAVILTDNLNELLVNRADLLNTLRRVMIFNKTTHQVIPKLTGNSLNVSAQDLDFSNEAKEGLDCQYSGEDMEIGFTPASAGDAAGDGQ